MSSPDDSDPLVGIRVGLVPHPLPVQHPVDQCFGRLERLERVLAIDYPVIGNCFLNQVSVIGNVFDVHVDSLSILPPL